MVPTNLVRITVKLCAASILGIVMILCTGCGPSTYEKISSAEENQDADALVRILKHREGKDRYQWRTACIALANLRDSRSVDCLLKILKESNDSASSEKAAILLRHIRWDQDEVDPRAIRALIEALGYRKILLPHYYTIRVPKPISVSTDGTQYMDQMAINYVMREMPSRRPIFPPDTLIVGPGTATANEIEMSMFRQVLGHGFEALRHEATYSTRIQDVAAESLRMLTRVDYGQSKSQWLRWFLETYKGASPEDVASEYVDEADTHSAKGQYDLAISAFSKAIETNPEHAGAYNNRGNAYFNKGEYNKALSDYNKAIEVDPGFFLAYYNRATIFQMRGEYGKALSDYDRAIALNAGDAAAYNSRGIVYWRRGEEQKAILDFKKAIEIDPKYARGFCNLGDVHSSKGAFDKAILDYNKAIEIDPSHASALGHRGIAYFRIGKYEEAWDDVNKAQALGWEANPGLLKSLREVSGRER